jgi:2-polyprenyl-3-methyl-5-hydroxy-6-metoxy-1,4-benzoquinol methylase
MKKIQYKACPVCFNWDGPKIKILEEIEGIWRLYCEVCGCIFFNDTPKNLPMYDLQYNLHFFRPGDIKKAGIMAETISNTISLTHKDPYILEAGTGNGLTTFLLQVMGYHIVALDLDSALSAYLTKKLGICVYVDDFLKFTHHRPFDCIYSSHVIEHCADPHEFIKKAYDLLAPRGILFLETPNTEYFTQHGKRWHHFETRHPFEHLTLLSTRSIGFLLKSTPFVLKSVENLSDFQALRVIFEKPPNLCI